MHITWLGGFLLRTHPRLRRFLWRTSYHYLARRFPDWDWTFTDYGFASGEDGLRLSSTDEPDRWGIQLYRRVASAKVDGLDVLDVGCGRGGGASYIARYLAQRRVVGLDIAFATIAFCRRRHLVPGLAFCVGDSEALPFRSETFDAVVNIESTHCYGSVQRLLSVVSRVLRSGGWLLSADMVDRRAIGELRAHLQACGFAPIEEEDITSGVLEAMAEDSDRKQAWISLNIPRPLRGVLAAFAGQRNTARYMTLRNGETMYMRWAARRTV